MNEHKYRSVFVSDIHLGTPACQDKYLLDFLQTVECETLYLVGDIFDLWSMKKKIHWSNTHNAIIQEVFNKAQNGTRVVYIPGNHDEAVRQFAGNTIQGVEIRLNAVHWTADNRCFYVSHGDEFDGEVRFNGLLKEFGDRMHSLMGYLSRRVLTLRRLLGLNYWSLAVFVKNHIAQAKKYIDLYEYAVATQALKLGYDGYICGHIHAPGIRKLNGKLYCNDGDWVEHCTAIVEDETGFLHMLEWTEEQRMMAVEALAETDEEHNVGIPALATGYANFMLMRAAVRSAA